MTSAGGRLLALLFAALLAGTARADDAISFGCNPGDENPDIPGFTKAQQDIKPSPRYPKKAIEAWSEGWLLLEHEIAADGTVRNIKVIDGVGSKDFVEETTRTFSRWRYKPATRNGTPVEQFLSQVQFEYRFFGTERGAEHDEFVRQYNKSRGQIQNNKIDDAIATLERAFEKRLNHYERAMGSFMLGLAYARRAIRRWPSFTSTRPPTANSNSWSPACDHRHCRCSWISKPGMEICVKRSARFMI